MAAECELKPPTNATPLTAPETGADRNATASFSLLPKKEKAARLQSAEPGFKKLTMNARGFQKPVLKLKAESFIANSAKKTMDVSDVKQLLLYPLAGCNAPQWASLENHYGVRCVVLVTIDGLGEAAVRENEAQFGQTAAVFGSAIPVNIPYSVSSATQILRFYSRCTKAVRGLSLVTAQSRFGEKRERSQPLEKYLLNAEEMAENKYPLKSPDAPRGDFTTLDPPPSAKPAETQLLLVSTADGEEPLHVPVQKRRRVDEPASEDTTPSPGNNRLLTSLEKFSKVNTLAAGKAAHIVAIDCEMVLTEKDRELARVTVVDFDGRAVYDEIVRPEAPVVDYCTRFSGIDEALMAGATKRLKDVHADLKKIIFSDTIICGHSLENDLEALKLHHERVIDTSLLYPHVNGPPYKVSLKNLTRKFLKQHIQQNEEGHNSAEDAAATLGLVKLKLSNGMAFGGQGHDFETIFSICRRFHKKTTLVAPAAVAKDLVGADISVSVITAESPQKCVAAAKAVLSGEKCCGFVWAVVGKQKRDGGEADEALAPAQIDAAVAELYGAARENTLFVVMSGHIEDKSLAEDHKKRREWLEKESKEWPGEKEYKEKLALLKKGLGLVAMK